jgi:hypothetical protein
MVRARVVVLSAIAACGPVDGAPPSDVPVNECGDSNPCRYNQQPSARCNAATRTCEVIYDRTKYEYTLTVTLPSSSTFAGLTYVVRSTDFPADVGHQGYQLARPGRVRGRYLVSPAGANDIGRNLFNTGVNTSLPVNATFHSLRDGAYAETLGLPLSTLFAPNTAQPPDGLPTAPDGGVLDNNAGPGGVTPLTYDTHLPPGTYERTLSPLAPFEDSFPPVTRQIVVPAGSDTTDDVSGPVYGQQDAPALDSPWRTTFLHEGGTIDGFRAWFRDAVTLQRVSSLGLLRSGQEAVLLTIGHNDSLEGMNLVLDPPAGSGMPYIVDSLVGGLKNPYTYPALPRPVRLTGRLLNSDGPIAGRVFIQSMKLDTLNPSAPEKEYLHYETSFDAPAGSYDVTLPAGAYNIYATPTGDGRLGQTTIESQSVAEFDGDISFPPLRRVRGRCVLTDGRTLIGAEVVARPALSLLGPTSKVRVEAWPRSVTTRTNDTGTFILALDYGNYDIYVRPVLGTHLPWFVLTNTVVAPPNDNEEFVLGDTVVPAPIHQSFLLKDPNGANIANASVRAFRKRRDGPELVEMGRALTDTQGQMDLFLSPYDP